LVEGSDRSILKPIRPLVNRRGCRAAHRPLPYWD
jgi:hypothetical protein